LIFRTDDDLVPATFDNDNIPVPPVLFGPDGEIVQVQGNFDIPIEYFFNKKRILKICPFTSKLERIYIIIYNIASWEWQCWWTFSNKLKTFLVVGSE